MRNLKKILALVLALVMSMSLLATANAFEDSKDIDADFTEAVEVLNALKVFQGYDNGKTFQPKGAITRAEVAAIIYRIVTGDVKDAQKNIYSDYNQFDDVTSDKWYAGYVNFCANAEIIKGYSATKFGPNDTVTGYQALAMILRAIGYDKNGEFTGTGWQVQTAAVAKKLGITNNIAAGTLGTAATREVVAEILFQTIAYAKQVDYTIAFGYSDWNNETLGYETFKLFETAAGADQWGRPSKNWMLDLNANHKVDGKDEVLVSLAAEAAASYVTAVDECTIAHDLGISKKTAIEAAFIDGEEYKATDKAVTSNRYGSIDPYATTSYVGAQGRLTEVYDMGAAGLRIVEINTYLGQVTKVVAEKTDKNGHITPAYVKINVYADNKSAGVLQDDTVLEYVTDEFAMWDYVLVTVSEASLAKDKVATAELTEAVATGALKNFTNSTTKVGADVYDDADKFVLYNTKNVNNYGKAYHVFTDNEGNIIGLVPVADNYLVIEAIEWVHNGLYKGYATANVVLANGDRVEDIVVATVNDTVVSNNGDDDGETVDATVSDFYQNNDNYYNHIATYTVNEDGSYNIGYNTTKNSICVGVAMEHATITKGVTTIKNETNTVVANDNTVFLVKDANGYTYTTYVGKNEVPNLKDATLCYLTNGYATLVVVTSYELQDNSFTAFIPASSMYEYVGKGLYAHKVYKVGETDETIIFSKDAVLVKDGNDGFYEIQVDADAVVIKAPRFIGTRDESAMIADGLHAGYSWSRAWVLSQVGGSLRTSWKNGAEFADYNVDETQYILVDKFDGETTLTAVDANAIEADQKVVVAYTSRPAADGTVDKFAKIVYIISIGGTDAAGPEIERFVTLDSVKFDSTKGASFGLTYNKVVDGKHEYPNVTSIVADVAIYTEAGVRVQYSESVATAENTDITVNTTCQLTQGDNYYAIITLTINGMKMESVKTDLYQAQPDVANTPAG